MKPADRDRELLWPLDWAIDGLFAGMLLFLPLAFGTTEAWSRQIWYGFIAAIGLCVLIKPFVHRTAGLRWSWTYLPMGLFMLLVIGQLLPLPRGVIEAISPGTLKLNGELLGPTGGQIRHLTFYRWASIQQLQMVAAVCCVMACVLQNYTRPWRIKRLLTLVTAAGLVVGLLTAYQDATQARFIYGIVPVGHSRAGPFQNYSHFSQFMNLSIGAALGLVLMNAAEWSAEDIRPRDWAERLSRPAGWPVAMALAVCVGGPILVLLSMSRMGAISTIIAGGATAALVGWRTRKGEQRGKKVDHAFLLVGLGLAVFAVLLAVGFDAVYARVASLKQTQLPTDTRWTLLQSLIPVWQQFPVLGTGLGTHEFVFPMFSKLNTSNLATHAENEYAQLMEECGAAGVLLMLVFVGMVVAAFVRAIRRPTLPVQFAAFGLGFGWIAILLHSFTDFGQHVPANATLTAVSAGLLVNIARLTRNPQPMRGPMRSSGKAIAIQTLALGGFVVCASWILWRSDISRRAETAWFEFYDAALALKGQQPTEDDFRVMLTAAGRAADLEPTNIAYRYGVSSLRWQIIERDAIDVETREQRFSAEAIEFSRQVAAELDAVRTLCPSYGPPLCVAGQIRTLVLKEPAGREDINLAYRLTPNDQTVCWARGLLATWDKDWPTAKIALDRFLLLGGERYRVVDAYLLANRPDLAFDAAAPDRWNLLRLASGLTLWPQQEALIARCKAVADEILVTESESPNASSLAQMERGQYESSQGNTTEAVLWYQKAVDREYGQVDWRMHLARAQAQAGQFAAAVQNLRVCLRLRPKLPEAEKLMAEYASAAGRAGQAPVAP